MPARDGMGPQGMGSITGKGMGSCVVENPTDAQSGQPFYVRMGRGFGLGRGLGFGMGRGLRRGLGFGMGRGFAQRQPLQNNSSVSNVENLKQQAKMLEQELGFVKKQIQDLDDKK